MITICLTHFRGLNLDNFRAALFTVRQQDLSRVERVIVLDNDSQEAAEDLLEVIGNAHFPLPVKLLSIKHGVREWAHAWSTNRVMQEVMTPLVLFTRSDYLLKANLLERFLEVLDAHGGLNWHGFVTGHVYHLHVGLARCEFENWRHRGLEVLRALPGVEEDYMEIDTGVWLARTDSFRNVGGLDERLTQWGHAQTHFQYKLYKAGVEFVRIPLPMFYHPQHGGARDINAAHMQLKELGLDLKEFWARYHGVSPYKDL